MTITHLGIDVEAIAGKLGADPDGYPPEVRRNLVEAIAYAQARGIRTVPRCPEAAGHGGRCPGHKVHEKTEEAKG